ncbi:phage tail tip fiber protein [Pseudomonas tolaasii]
MSGSIQSSNYVPRVSGWKLNALTGDYEINSSSIALGSLPSDPQPITITAGEWSDYDLPANAVERHAFIGAELEKIPAECRNSAEFTTEDFSFDRDGSDYRTTLTYVRQETHEEAMARQEKAKEAGTRVSIKNGLMTVTHDGRVRIKLGNLDQPELEQPFKVDGDQVFINDATIQDGIVKSPLWAAWGVRMERGENGRYYAAGIGLPSQILVSADRFAINDRGASDILRDIAGMIGETKLGEDLKEQVELLGSNLADQVKAVIRNELMPGGLLHRSR